MKQEPKSDTRPKRAARPEPFERASDWLTGNFYVNLGLTKEEVKALTAFGKRRGIKKSPCAEAARLLIAVGLLNLDSTEDKLEATLNYMRTEGFHTFGCLMTHAMKPAKPVRNEEPMMTLPVSSELAGALNYFTRKWLETGNITNMAGIILHIAMMHGDAIDKCIEMMLSERRAEGMEDFPISDYLKRRVAAHPEYQEPSEVYAMRPSAVARAA